MVTKRSASLIPRAKKISRAPSAGAMVEDVLGCKWSLAVLDAVARGISRPGAMERAIDGLSSKVLNERLRKLTRYGIVARRSYAEIPPRVEYRLTSFGRRFGGVLERIGALQREIDQAAEAPSRSARR